MKNIQIIDGAENTVYDIFQATDDEFAVIFPDGTDLAFSDEISDRADEQSLIALFTEIWKRQIPKKDAHGMHGMTRKGEEAINPNGSRLR